MKELQEHLRKAVEELEKAKKAAELVHIPCINIKWAVKEAYDAANELNCFLAYPTVWPN